MNRRCFASGSLLLALSLAAALPAAAQEAPIRGYVTQIEANSAANELRIWVAPEKGSKGLVELSLDMADPLLIHKLTLARDSLKRRLPVKILLNAKGQVSSFFLRYYPSKRQRQE